MSRRAADPRSRVADDLRRSIGGLSTAATSRMAEDLPWFRELSAAGVPAGPINTVDGGVAFAESLGLDPVVRIGPDAVPSVRHPITFSETPADYRLPPPELDEHGAEIRAWLKGEA